jgi:hypothetical protein
MTSVQDPIMVLPVALLDLLDPVDPVGPDMDDVDFNPEPDIIDDEYQLWYD